MQTNGQGGVMRAVIFDLDGTLIDSAPDIQAAVNRALADFDCAPLDLPTVISFIGNGLPKLAERVHVRAGLADGVQTDLTQRLMTYYNENPLGLTTLYPDCLDALAYLRDAGVKIGLCTNKPYAPAVHILDHLQIAQYFDAVIGGDSLAVKKPDPAPLRETMSRLQADDVLYVGDSPVDYQTAQNAAVDFAFFTQGYRNEPLSYFQNAIPFDDYQEFLRILRRRYSA